MAEKKKKRRTKGRKERNKIITKKQIKKENKILRNFLFGVISLIIIVLLVALSINSTRNFEYEGLKFNIVKAGQVKFYHTSFPLIADGRDITYNVYLRNDPRGLKDVAFDGEVNLLEMMVLDNTESFICDGDGGIAILNLQQILGALGTTIIKDPDAACDPQGRFMFLRIQSGDETSIKQFGPACYEININNCEILEGTERFIIEVLVEARKAI